MEALRAVIDATGLFPSEMLDGMLRPFLNGDRTGQRWLTINKGGGPVAIAHYAPERMTTGTWNLLLIAVHPAQQSRGIGQTLMQHVETSLAAAAQRVLLVETSGLAEFERTRSFYRQLGYAEEARIRDYYDAGEDKVIFRKALSPSP